MPRGALKAQWIVQAGVIPLEAMAEYTRSWSYTSDELESDRETSQDQPTIFSKRDTEAHEYARSITDPARINWVRVTFMWM